MNWIDLNDRTQPRQKLRFHISILRNELHSTEYNIRLQAKWYIDMYVFMPSLLMQITYNTGDDMLIYH